ncbi:CdaR family protein [Spirochaetia bacterium 38H-sp]|uniref:CdaR family protein n=1 Tax=Rarispira pelagica TaxID=3141764 RepID=A0ABU9UDQ0_9SPIR
MKNSIEGIRGRFPALIVSILIAVTLFFIHRLGSIEERFLSVPIEVKMPDNLISRNPLPEKVRLTLRGESDEIYSVIPEDLSVYADFTAIRVPGEHTVALQLIRSSSATNANVEYILEPSSVRLELAEKLSKTLEVIPRFSGVPAPGYTQVGYTVSPSYVLVEGPSDVLGGIDSISTEQIDLSGKKSDIVSKVRLVIPAPGVVVPGGNVVDLIVNIRELVEEREFSNLDVVFLDLLPELSVGSEVEKGYILVQGNRTRIEGLIASDLQLIVDCSSVSAAGFYELPVIPKAPEGIAVLDYKPRRVSVFITGAVGEEGAVR